MGPHKIKINSYCVGGKYRSSKKTIVGEISLYKKTDRENKLLVRQCSLCNRKKSMTVRKNTIEAEVLGDFLKNLG